MLKIYNQIKRKKIPFKLFSLMFILLLANGLYAQTNVAPSATASAAPACNTGACSTLNDLNFGTCGSQQMWITSAASNPGSGVNITFVWPTTQVVNKMTIHVGQDNTRFLTGGTVQYWNGTSWVTHATFTQATGVCQYDINFNPVATSQLRIIDMTVGGTQASNVNFREIQIWQGSLSNNDVGIVSIDSIGTVCSTASMPVYATIANFGKNQITSANVLWSINGATQGIIPFTGTLDTLGGASSNKAAILLGSTSFSNTPSTIKSWTSQPNGTADTIRVNDTSAVSRVVGIVGGTYTVGGVGANYATVTAAINALYSRGICGPVTFLVASGTYNEQVAMNGEVVGSSDVNTITFKGASKATTILNFASTNTAQRHTLLISGGAKYVTFRDMTIQGNGNFAGDYAFPLIINGTGTRIIRVANCNIQIVGANSLSGTTFYIPVVIGGTSASYSTGARMDSIEIDSNFISRGYFGLVHYGISGNLSRNIKVRNNVFNEVFYYGIFYSQIDNITIERNTFNMQAATTGVTPIYVSVGTAGVGRNHSIVGNIIPTYGTYAMFLNSVTNQPGSKGLIANNAIGGNNIQGTGYGIYAGSCTNNMFYHNSINMANGGSTGVTNAALFITSGSGNSVINNNLARTSVGWGVPLYLSAAAVADTVNYNNYFKVDTVTAFIFVGGNLLPSAFRGASGFNVNSTFNNPDFVSANNLNITLGCNNGINLPLISTDINGTLRASLPDVGAYETTTVGNNLGIEKIYTPTVGAFTPGSSDVWALVRNYGTNTVATYDVGYTNNGGTAVTTSISTAIASCDTASVYFTGANQVLLGASNKLKVFTNNPNASLDSMPANDTLVGDFFSPLSGNYTIGGATANFLNFTSAVNALKGSGVSGPVTFTVNPGTFNEEVIINGVITGLSSTTPIEFIGVDKNTVIVSANKGSGPVVSVVLNSYITFRNMTIRNLSPSGSGFAVIGNNLSFLGTGCGIINCVVDMPNYTTGVAYPIIVTGTANGYGLAAMRCDSITIDSNTFNGGYYGIAVYGATNAFYNRFIRIRSNTGNNIYYMGAYILLIYNAIEFTRNTLNMNPTYGYCGVYYLSNTNSSTTVSHVFANNKIINHGFYGFYFSNLSANAATAAENLVYNNMVISGSTYNSVYGVYLQDQSASRTLFYNNTLVNRYANTQPTYGVLYTTGSTNVKIKNNVFANLSGSGLPIYMGTSPAAGNVNYNNYFNTSGTSLVYRNGVYHTVSTYKLAANGGDSSFNVNPNFVSGTDAHTTNSCLPRGVDVTPVVTVDIDETVRAIPPMIGCDEIVAGSNDLEVVALTSPSVPVALGAQDLRLLVKNRGANSVSSFNVAYRLNNGAPVIMSYSGSGLATCDTVTMVFTGANQITIGTGANAIKAYSYSPNASIDSDRSNDTINTSVAAPLIGNYIVGAAPSDFIDLNTALAAAGTRGLGGRTTFRIKTGVYNGTYNIVDIPGASATSTLNITSFANHRDSVRLEFSIDATTTQVVNMAASFVNFNKLTIRQTNGVLNVTNAIIRYSGVSNFDTINDCVIWGPISGVDGTSTSNYGLYNNAISTNNLVYTNNYFKGSFYGNYLYGNSVTYNIKNTLFENNLFDSIAYGSFYYLYYTTGSKFIGNTFNNRIVNPTYTTGYQYWYYNDSAYVMENNRVNCMGSKGIYWYMNYSKNAISNPALVRNNIITGGTSGFVYWSIGGSVTNNYHVANNTVHAGSQYTYLIASGNTNMRIINNVFTSNNVYAFYWTVAPPAISQVLTNHNLYRSNISTTPIYATAARTLTAFKVAYPTYDRNSVSFKAPHTSLVDLTPNVNDTAIWLINGRGVHDTLVTKDINNVTRPATVASGAPDLGAFEVTPASGVLAPLATIVPAIPVLGGTQHILLGEDSVARVTWDISSSIPTAGSMRYYTGERPNTQGANGKAINAAYDLVLSGSGLIYDITLLYKRALLGTVGSQTDLRSANYYNSSWNVRTASLVDSVNFNVIATAVIDSNSVWTLTDALDPLTTFLNITSQPVSQTKCNGDSVIFTTTATGTGLSYQWQQNAGGGFTNITGATTATLVVNGLNASFNGRMYRCTITNLGGTANTNSATLTMGVQTNITTQPVNGSGCLGDNVTFSAAAVGTNLSYSWEESTGGAFSSIGSATSPSLIQTNIQLASNGNRYRALISGTCGNRTSDTAMLTVSGPITITSQPAPTSVSTCAGSTVVLSMAATGATTFQWQIDLGSGYSNIAGATTSTLTISSVPSSYNGGNIRCALTNACNVAFTNLVPMVVQTPGLWSGNTSSSWTTTSNWGCSALPTSAVDVVIPATAFNMPVLAGSANMKGLSVNSGATLTMSTSASALNIYGDLTNIGTISGTTGWINMMGTTQQSINGGSYNKVSVNNTTGVKLTGALTVVDTLQLTNGKVELGVNDLNIGNTGRILGVTSTNYIVTNDLGSLVIGNIGVAGRTGAVVFPIGTLTNYNPISLTNTGTADQYSSRVIVGAFPTYTGNVPSGAAVSSNAVAANWIVSESVNGGSNLSVTLQWNGTQELSGFTRGSSYVARYMANGWNNFAAGAAVGTDPYTRTIGGLTTLNPMGVGSNGTLPVSWLSLTASVSGKDAVIDWATGSEVNNKGFEVERSFNGNEFEVVGFVKGAGNSASVQTYSFVDAKVLSLNSNGDVYYRLKQIDRDGNFEYSKVVMLTATENDDITLYPNPFNNEAGIFVSSLQDTKVSIEVKDLMGRNIFTTEKEVIKGNQYISIDNLANLSNGMYLVQVNMNGELKSFKVQKTN